MQKAILSGIVAASLLIPTLGHAQTANAEPATTPEQATGNPLLAIEIEKWTVLSTLAVVSYFVYGFPTTQAVGYLFAGAMGGYMSKDWAQREAELQKP